MPQWEHRQAPAFVFADRCVCVGGGRKKCTEGFRLRWLRLAGVGSYKTYHVACKAEFRPFNRSNHTRSPAFFSLQHFPSLRSLSLHTKKNILIQDIQVFRISEGGDTSQLTYS